MQILLAQSMSSGADLSGLLSFPLQISSVAELLGAGGPGTAAAWVHYIAFDLIVGRYVYFDGLENNVFTRHSLVGCLMFGPVGFISHLITRSLTMLFRKQRTE